MLKQYEDRRADFFHLGEESSGCHSVVITGSTDAQLITGRYGKLFALMIVQGANPAIVTAYDSNDVSVLMAGQRMAVVSVSGVPNQMDGFTVNVPIQAERGIVVQLDQADAIATVLYKE